MKTQNEIAAICKTCKEAENRYKELIESGISKEEAKKIIKEAKQIINNRKATAKTEKTAVKGWFGNFENIGKSLGIGFIKEFEGTKAEFNKYQAVSEFVANWITRADANGQPIHKVKGIWQYRDITAQNIRSILRECFVNIVASNNGQEVKYIRIDSVEVAAK